MPKETTEITLTLEGLHCASCVARAEKALAAVPGVEQALVNLATRQARVRFDAQQATVEKMQDAITEAGYTVTGWALEAPPPVSPEIEAQNLKRRFLLALILSLPVFLGAMVPPLPGWLGLEPQPLAFLLLICTTPVLFYSGAPFFRGALSAARHGAANMDTLVALGTSAAYFYSAGSDFWPQSVAAPGHSPELYFDTTAMIITFIILGRWLEARTRGRASQAIRRLFALAPPHRPGPPGRPGNGSAPGAGAGGRPGDRAPRGEDTRGRGGGGRRV